MAAFVQTPCAALLPVTRLHLLSGIFIKSLKLSAIVSTVLPVKMSIAYAVPRCVRPTLFRLPCRFPVHRSQSMCETHVLTGAPSMFSPEKPPWAV